MNDTQSGIPNAAADSITESDTQQQTDNAKPTRRSPDMLQGNECCISRALSVNTFPCLLVHKGPFHGSRLRAPDALRCMLGMIQRDFLRKKTPRPCDGYGKAPVTIEQHGWQREIFSGNTACSSGGPIAR